MVKIDNLKMKLTDLNKLLNSELTTKIKDTIIKNSELLVNVELNNLYSAILFLKTDSIKSSPQASTFSFLSSLKPFSKSLPSETLILLMFLKY